MRFITCFIALYLWTSAASAAIFTYVLDDHPDGAKTPPYDYGLRLDGAGVFYSFSEGNAFLTFDSNANTATISGTVNESNGDGTIGSAVPISYLMNVSMDSDNTPGIDPGFFKADSGTGSVGSGGDQVALTGTGMGDGIVFKFLNDGHRLPGNSAIAGRGWVIGGGTNDFLVTATLVPIPAAVWLFGSAMLAFFGFARRKGALAA